MGDEDAIHTVAGAGEPVDVEKGYTTGSSYTSAFPLRSATFHLPDRHRTPTTTELVQREKTLEATQSIGGLSLSRASARQGLDPRARVAAEFRTLSVQIEDGVPVKTTKKSKKQTTDKGKSTCWGM